MGKSISVTLSMSMPMSCAFWETQKKADGIIARDVLVQLNNNLVYSSQIEDAALT